jgi:hypothetical protein
MEDEPKQTDPYGSALVLQSLTRTGQLTSEAKANLLTDSRAGHGPHRATAGGDRQPN